MRAFRLTVACLGASLLVACTGDSPTTRTAAQEPSNEVPTAVLQALRSGSPPQVEQAVAWLADVLRVSEADIERVAQISREADEVSNRIGAITVLERWLAQPASREAAARALIETARGPHEHMVRGMAVQALALQPKANWPEDVVAGLGDLVRSDPLPQNREIAALALGHVRGPFAEAALQSLVEAYAGERNRSSRRAMLLNIVEVAGSRAPSVLAGLPETSSLIVQDIQDYQEILARGERDIDRIWDLKFARDIERGTVIGTEKENAQLKD